jgi:hypothetical protein
MAEVYECDVCKRIVRDSYRVTFSHNPWRSIVDAEICGRQCAINALIDEGFINQSVANQPNIFQRLWHRHND